MRVALNSGIVVRILVLTTILGPIVLGLFQNVVSIFGQKPYLDIVGLSPNPLHTLLTVPGLVTAVITTLFTGIAATAISLVLAFSFCIIFLYKVVKPRKLAIITMLLSAPHVVVAIGLTFLMAPSGWVFRLFASLSDFESPPDIFIVNDPFGVSLVVGLVIKEVPFLIFVIMASITQIPIQRNLCEARALGYDLANCWIRVIVPQIWPLVRLPVFVVLAYSLANVEMAVVLGPTNPPVLSVLLMRMFLSPDVTFLAPASAGALLQVLLVLAVFLIFYLVEMWVRFFGRIWLCLGNRSAIFHIIFPWIAQFSFCVLSLGCFALFLSFVWSFASHWRWPSVVPENMSTQNWIRFAPDLIPFLGDSIFIASSATLSAIILAIAWFQTEKRDDAVNGKLLPFAICIPLFIPQIGFLFGLNTVFLKTLKYKPKKILKLGHSNIVNVGDAVHAVGYPLGLDNLKITKGVLSGRQFGKLQMDTPISGGNSGGPLMYKNKVVGICASSLVGTQAQNINFAVPIELFHNIKDRLLKDKYVRNTNL